MDFEIVFGIVERIKLHPKDAFLDSTLLTSLIDSHGIADATRKQISQSVHFLPDLFQSSFGFCVTLASSFSMRVLPVPIERDRLIDCLTLAKLLSERAQNR